MLFKFANSYARIERMAVSAQGVLKRLSPEFISEKPGVSFIYVNKKRL